jgi:hypothetical protein
MRRFGVVGSEKVRARLTSHGMRAAEAKGRGPPWGLARQLFILRVAVIYSTWDGQSIPSIEVVSLTSGSRLSPELQRFAGRLNQDRI